MRPRLVDSLPALLLLAALMFPLRGGFTDDGFIHVQYARNLMTRGEYSFNPGETSFGTTSPLWVMALAVLARPFHDDHALVVAGQTLSWLAAFAAVLVFQRILTLLGATRRVAIFAMVAFAADVWLVRWGALGMESSLAACMAALMVAASVRAYDDTRAAAAFGAAAAVGALVRPELYLALPVYMAGALTRRPRPSARVVFTAALFTLLLVGPWLAFAKWHIGSFLPNTAGAKSGGFISDPVLFAKKLMVPAKIVASSQAVALVAMLADLLVSKRRAFVLSPSFRFAALWMLALPLAYVLADIQVLSRYLLLITPAVCAGGWVSLQSLWFASRERVQAFAWSCALMLALAINGAVYALVVIPPSRAFSSDLQVNMVGLARYLHDHAQPGAVVAAADIGYLAFYSGCRVLDLGGLVEPETGKLRAQYDYEDIVARGLYFNVRGYPHVDYLVDREHVANRFDGQIVNGHHFEKVYMTTVRNLGIRKPGQFYYTLYHITPVTP
ncbi:MAG TPA: hypothetical protein VJS69_10690 [Candidatus Krumholzibacteria bacterium]|nr:hypothetical protein [Candidatus Krumholzibacteria bacterium]